MQTKIFSVFDSKAKAFMAPFTMGTVGMALRSFEEVANNRDHLIGKHPDDFSLYEIGTFDDEFAQITARTPLNLIGVASEYVKNQGEDAIEHARRQMHTVRNGAESAIEVK